MECLVGQYDFMTAGQSEKSAMDDELRMYKNKNETVVTEDDVLAAFRILRNGVCRPDFPGKNSQQCIFACHVLKELISMSRELLDGSRISSLDRIYEFCLDFGNDLLRQGPGSSHIQMIQELWEQNFKLKYYKTLSGDRLKNQVRLLKRELRTREKGTNQNSFLKDIDGLIRCVLDFRVEQYQQARQEFIDLYLFMEYSFLCRPKAVHQIHSYFASKIGDACKRGKFDIFLDLEPVGLKACLKTLENIICNMNFYTADSENTFYQLGSAISSLLEPVKKHYWFTEINEELLDFVINICKKKVGTPLHTLVKKVDLFYYHYEDGPVKDPKLQENSNVFTVMMTKIIHFLTTLEDHSLMSDRFTHPLVTAILVKNMDKSLEHRRLMLDLFKACLKIHQYDTTRTVATCLQKCKHMFNWKENLDDAREILDLVLKVRLRGTEKAKHDVSWRCADVCDYLGYQMIRDKVVQDLTKEMLDFSLKILKNREPLMFNAGSNIAWKLEFNKKKHKDLIMRIFPELLIVLTDPNLPWGTKKFRFASEITEKLTEKGMRVLESIKLEPKDYKVISNFLITVMRGNFFDEDDDRPGSVYYTIYCESTSTFIHMLDNQEKMIRAILLINEIVKLLKHDNDNVQKTAIGHIQGLVHNGSRVMAPFMQKIMDAYMETEDDSLLYSISYICDHNQQPLVPHFQKIFELIDGKNRDVVLTILVEVAKKQPHLFTENNIKRIIEEMFGVDDRYQTHFCMVLDPLAKKHAPKFLPYLDTLMEGPINIKHGSMFHVSKVLKNVAVRTDEATADKVMDFLEKHINGPEDQMVTMCCLNEMRAIGGVHRGLLEKRKGTIENLRKRSNVQTTKDACTFILDVLEGRSLESLAVELKDVKEDVEVLEVRVTATEEGLVLVNQRVGKQEKELKKVKVNVKKQGKKIGQLEDTVGDTKAKIEELDSKSLSHAPFWARDVAKLMNPEDILDWRFLASRLGYSNDDVRSWSQMHDPCMAMLNEWYATRKTSEASFAVLTQLQEMDRTDAVVIVENAMKMAEKVVEDDSFDYPEPPDVFISYQWGVQNEIKLLKQHLEMAGFTCWMDIGQMGGGDKLFEKIDKGIRGAKVVLSCVTEKYAKSPNCNREVNLSVGLGKPIIPLLMEKMSWPPPGSMGPVFSEYLFIRFFSRSGEETGDERYWSATKFQELIMQLNYNNIKPDEGKVDSSYNNWWNPVAEVIKIEKKNMKPDIRAKQEEVESEAATPDVFISYQWDKQKQIQLLYKRLTELGFTCWMDIYQMGGGDSLYDKIDKGVRGAKIVLSCVTSKYSVSANCRREVSLADALKKPIVPLLLEKMTWPPSGPMSIVFAQHLYITFAKDEYVQEIWDEDMFGELLFKLDQHVPGILVIPSTEEEPEASPETGKHSSEQAAMGVKPPSENSPSSVPKVESAQDNRAITMSHESHQPNSQITKTLNKPSYPSHKQHNQEMQSQQPAQNQRNPVPHRVPEKSPSKSCNIL